ncbi:MAG: hypothetical protein ACSHX8_07350 [Opitutaceae bacterium]
MKSPPLPSDKLEQTATPAPVAWLTRGKIVILIVGVIVAFIAAMRSGSLTLLPFMIGTTLLPLLWLARLVDCVRRGVITNRIRTGSRTTRLIAFTVTGPPDIYYRQLTPFRFWMTWLIEVALFIFITPFFWVIVLGPIIEGGPKL